MNKWLCGKESTYFGLTNTESDATKWKVDKWNNKWYLKDTGRNGWLYYTYNNYLCIY